MAIPDSVTTIGAGAFYNVPGLNSLTIPDSVTTIGDNAFYDDYNLTELFIPDSWADDGVTLSNNMFNYSCFFRYCYNPNLNAAGPKIVCQGETNNCYKALESSLRQMT